jgi:hypothetical protein
MVLIIARLCCQSEAGCDCRCDAFRHLICPELAYSRPQLARKESQPAQQLTAAHSSPPFESPLLGTPCRTRTQPRCWAAQRFPWPLWRHRRRHQGRWPLFSQSCSWRCCSPPLSGRTHRRKDSQDGVRDRSSLPQCHARHRLIARCDIGGSDAPHARAAPVACKAVQVQPLRTCHLGLRPCGGSLTGALHASEGPYAGCACEQNERSTALRDRPLPRLCFAHRRPVTDTGPLLSSAPVSIWRNSHRTWAGLGHS